MIVVDRRGHGMALVLWVVDGVKDDDQEQCEHGGYPFGLQIVHPQRG